MLVRSHRLAGENRDAHQRFVLGHNRTRRRAKPCSHRTHRARLQLALIGPNRTATRLIKTNLTGCLVGAHACGVHVRARFRRAQICTRYSVVPR